MKPDLILQADVLDIIFENRNKEYGAYELRRHYDQRMAKSMITVFLVLMLGFALSWWFGSNSGQGALLGPTRSLLDTLTPVSMVPDPVQVHKPLQRQAMLGVTKPLTVPDPQATNPLPTVEEENASRIGRVSQPGDSSDRPSPPEGGEKGNKPSLAAAQAPEPAIFADPEVMPEFPGGLAALRRFLMRNLKMPPGEMEPGGKVVTLVRFVVDKDGSITGINMEKSGGQSFDREVERVVRIMPHWKPGSNNGKMVAVYFKLPVLFQVPDDN